MDERCIGTRELGEVLPLWAFGSPLVQHGVEEYDLRPKTSPAFSCPARGTGSNLLPASFRLLS